jgi:predicted ATPase
MSRAGHGSVPEGWAGELVDLFRRLRLTCGADPVTGKPASLRQIAKRSGYVPSHVRAIINGQGRPSPEAVMAVAGALNASDEDRRLAAFYAEHLPRSPAGKATAVGSARTSGDAPTADPGAASALVGRDAEFERLHGWLREAIRGRGRSVLIEGEPGIGKSSLMRAVAGAAEPAGCQVFWASCDELSQAFPLLPLLDVLDGRSTAGQPGIGELLRSSTLPGDQTNLVQMATERLLTLVGRLCDAAPVLLVVDDVQWADPATVTTLGRLARLAPQRPLLTVATARPVPRRDDLDALRRVVEPSAVLTLGGLASADVSELVARVTSGIPGVRLLLLAADAGGNPLYVTELVEALARGGRLSVDSGVVEAASGPAPHSLSATIADRLRFLPTEVRDMLRIAALLGTDFSVSDLSTVSGRRVGELLPVLDNAIRARVLLDEGPEIAFRHPLIRNALYEAMPPRYGSRGTGRPRERWPKRVRRPTAWPGNSCRR